MKRYYLNKNVFIRYEKDLPINENVLIFVAENGEMFKANKDVYDVLELIKKGLNFIDIITELKSTYVGSSSEEIEFVLKKIIDNLKTLGVVSEDESIKI